MLKPELEKELLPLREAARFLGVSRSSLLRLEEEGHLAPFRTAGGHRRYDRAALAAFRARRRKPAAASPKDAERGIDVLVSRVGAALLLERDRDSMLEQAVTAARFVTRASLAAYFPLDLRRGSLKEIVVGGRSACLRPYLEALLPGNLMLGLCEHIPDAVREERFGGIAAPSDVGSLMAVPVCRGGLDLGEVRGVLMVAHRCPGRLGDAAEDLLWALAIQVGMALENGRVYDELARRNRRLTVLNRAATELIRESDTDTVLRRVLEGCREVTGASQGIVEYHTPDGESLCHDCAADQDFVERLAGLSLPSRTFSGEAALLSDDAADGQPSPGGSVLAMPLSSTTGSFLGGVFLGHPEPGYFDAAHAEMVRTLTLQAVAVLEGRQTAEQNAMIHHEMESIFHGIADPLTVIDRDLTIVECNAGLLRRLGKPREEVVGRHYFEALVGNVEEHLWNVAPRVFETGEPQTARVPMVTGEGASLLMDVSAYPVRDTRGKVVRVVEYAKEVTAEVRLQLALMDRNLELNDATRSLAFQAESLSRQAAEMDRLNRDLREKCAELEHMAVTDVMTGLLNHRAFQQGLLREMRRAKRYRFPLSLLLIDVDHFKAYNDSFGHPAGDGILRAIGKLLPSLLRDSDLAARYGGEEFAIVLPYADKERAVMIAERVRAAVEAHRFPKRAITVSVGVASCFEDADDKDPLIELADRALYRAKQAGRNAIFFWDTTVPPLAPAA